MHIYSWQIDPQLSIDVLSTTTPNLAHLKADLYIERENNAHIPRADVPPPCN